MIKNIYILILQWNKTLGNFKLLIEPGLIKCSEIIVLLGENGIGKSTLVHLLANLIKPDNEEILPSLKISIKPQKITPKADMSVESVLNLKIKESLVDPAFIREVVKPLEIEGLYLKNIKSLSGGELQRVVIIIALGRPWDVYLIDEPSAYLDSDQRLVVAKVLKRWILKSNRAALIVEHDFIMASYLADRVIVFEGTPAKEAKCSPPQDFITGMNIFLKSLDVTFRRDSSNFRPIINKLDSQKDREQKSLGWYFIIDDYMLQDYRN